LDPKLAEAVETRYKMQAAFQMPVEVGDATFMQKAARRQPQRAIPSDNLAYLYDGPSIGYLRAPVANSTLSRATQLHQERLGQRKVSFDDGLEAPAQDSKSETDPLKKHVDDLYNTLVDKVTEKLKDQLSKSEADKTKSILDENQSNESLIKSALQYSEWRDRARLVLANVRDVLVARSILAGMIFHSIGGWEAVRKANRFTGPEILVVDRLISRFQKRASMAGEARVYRTVIAVGGMAPYPNVNRFLEACRKVMGRVPTDSERALLVEKSKLFSMGL